MLYENLHLKVVLRSLLKTSGIVAPLRVALRVMNNSEQEDTEIVGAWDGVKERHHQAIRK